MTLLRWVHAYSSREMNSESKFPHTKLKIWSSWSDSRSFCVDLTTVWALYHPESTGKILNVNLPSTTQTTNTQWGRLWSHIKNRICNQLSWDTNLESFFCFVFCDCWMLRQRVDPMGGPPLHEDQKLIIFHVAILCWTNSESEMLMRYGYHGQIKQHYTDILLPKWCMWFR